MYLKIDMNICSSDTDFEYHFYLNSTQVALVGQEPVLYARSIKDNIAYAMEDTPLEQVERAAKQANAHGFITDLEGKYYAETGEKGAQVSGKIGL